MKEADTVTVIPGNLAVVDPTRHRFEPKLGLVHDRPHWMDWLWHEMGQLNSAVMHAYKQGGYTGKVPGVLTDYESFLPLSPEESGTRPLFTWIVYNSKTGKITSSTRDITHCPFPSSRNVELLRADEHLFVPSKWGAEVIMFAKKLVKAVERQEVCGACGHISYALIGVDDMSTYCPWSELVTLWGPSPIMPPAPMRAIS